jgi:phage tail-like protein
MARAVASDFLHSMRFHVDIADPNTATFAAKGRPGAGFSMVSTPEATTEAVEYKEGTFIYTRKYPGNPTVADITMSRGVARGDSTFWDWMRRVIEGSGEYRADLNINHYHRLEALNREYPTTGAEANLTELFKDSPARVYKIKEAFPTRHKVAGDLDGTASEISIMELDIAFEYFEVEEKGA